MRIPRLTKHTVLLNSLQGVATSTWEMAHLYHSCSDTGLPFRVFSPPPRSSWYFVDVSVTVVKVNKNAFKGFHGKHGV